MGNLPGCLSNRGSLLNDPPSFCEVDDAELFTAVQSSDGELFNYPAPLLIKDVMSGLHGCFIHKPVDHPDAQLSFNTSFHDSLAHTLHSASLRLRETSAAVERLSKKPKVSKKVRFADEPVLLTAPCSYQQVAQNSIGCNGELQCEELSQKKQSCDDGKRSQSCFGGVEDEITSAPLTRQGEGKGNSLNGVVRLKVFISRREYTELMSPQTPEKQAEAMVKRIIGPLLSPP